MYIIQAIERLKRVLIFENRRNQLQVLNDILELCSMPRAKTCILRNTNTSKLLENYLLQLQVSNLLELQPGTKKFITTKEGQKFIQARINLTAILNPQESPIFIKTKKHSPHTNQFIIIPINNANYLTE